MLFVIFNNIVRHEWLWHKDRTEYRLRYTNETAVQ